MSSKTFYGWRARYGGMVGTELRKMKELEATIFKLERIVARQAVEIEASRMVIRGEY